jgi:hypothetical protein
MNWSRLLDKPFSLQMEETTPGGEKYMYLTQVSLHLICARSYRQWEITHFSGGALGKELIRDVKNQQNVGYIDFLSFLSYLF